MTTKLFSDSLYAEEDLFSQGTTAGKFTLLAQDARKPDGSLTDPADIKAQTRQALENLRIALRAADQGLEHLASLTVFVTDYEDGYEVAEVLRDSLPDPEKAYPATTFVGVMGLDGGCRVRVDALATSYPDREQIRVASVPYPLGSCCHAVRVGELLFLSGVDAADSQGKVSEPVSIETQTLEVLNRIEAILRAQKLSLNNICRTFMFLPGTEYRPGYGETRRKKYQGFFSEDEFPPNSGIYVKDLGQGILLKSVAIAYSGRVKTTLHSPKVREAPGSFSQAVRAGNWLFVAGQDSIGFNREVEAVGDLSGQTNAALRHIKDIVEEAGGTLNDVVKTTVYLVAGQDRSVFADTYQQFLKSNRASSLMPAGLTLEVKELAPSCLVEIDAVAFLGTEPT